ncbi:MAG: sigma-54 dependent transcriptional regulator [Pseudomonadota bacterium]
MTNEPRILLIEDDPIMGESLMDRFELEGMLADWAQTGAEGRRRLESRTYGVVLSDIRLPDMGGDALFLEQAGSLPAVPSWLFITGYGAVDQAVRLLKNGAADYIAKPFELDALIDKLRRHLAIAAPRPAVEADVLDLGISPALRRIEAQLPRIAAQARTLLITGESGVGKEMVARAFHRLTPEGEGSPFIAVNCAAIPETLLEAELFGHEKGAFTGASRLRRGVFEQADGGTLFLDEIGDMPLAMQAKLLRVLQERRVTRLGGEKSVPVDLRLVSATHQDLKKLVTLGRFREDLYYRLDVIHVHIPPLRQRREDILWLARRFLEEVAPGKRLTADAEQAVVTHDWPGNARELKHAIERGAILASGPLLGPAALFGTEDEASELPRASLAEFVAESEKRYISKALADHDGHIGRTAGALGISRKNLWEKMRKLGLSADRNNAD